MGTNQVILFYGHVEGEYKSFSNFYPVCFTHADIEWGCSEAAYMFYKSEDKKYRKQIIAAKDDPYKVKKLGRQVDLRKGWDDMKFSFMYEVLLDKFSQNEDIKELLLSTDNKMIHENCKDPWWGGGPNFPNGKDLLGKCLRKVRAKLKDNA